MAAGSLPYRGTFGDPRPPALSSLALPPAAMPGRQGLRALKSWRYVGVYGRELMLCMAAVRIGPARQQFWAVWDRKGRRLYERTITSGGGPLRLWRGGATLRDGDVRFELALDETAGVETVCATPDAYAWTRKQGGIPARGIVWLDGRAIPLHARAVVDDTAAYYPRHTSWHWCAGIGRARDGSALAWNLVSGVNDPPVGSERTVWVDGEPREVGPCRFASDLSAVDDLRFDAESERRDRQNLLIVRSSYRQPFGTFSGSLPGGLELADGYGVMEEHDVHW